MNIISSPGTGYGPCARDCAHRDCAWQRRTAAKACTVCGQPIGYDRHFVENDSGVTHTGCLPEYNKMERTTH